MAKGVKTALHHWWPRGLSQFWEDGEGGVTALNPDGSERRSSHDQFGAITNAHAVKIDGPWSFSFEDAFDKIDSRIGTLITELLAFDAPAEECNRQGTKFKSHEVADEFLDAAGKLMASLIARCPRNRNSIAKTTEYHQSRFGHPNPKADKNLINLNLRSSLQYIQNHFKGGKFVLAFSDNKEFIFGDGFYTNMATESRIGHLKSVIPITPVMALIFSKPSQYFTYPKFVTCRLDGYFVDLINELTMVYSGRNIFYRSQKPQVGDGFNRGEFLQYEYHRVPWLERFLTDVHAIRGSVPLSK
jgi:hypothetical protein